MTNYYQVQPGLFAGEYPGSQHPETARKRLDHLVGEGVTTFIDLTTREDALVGLDPYEQYLAEIDPSGSHGLARYSFEIPDMNIPTTPEVMRGVLDRIRDEIAAGRICYVHCWGGIGRTGTAVGCWLKEAGLDGDTALARVQELYGSHMDAAKLARYPHSPQQPRQLKYVRDWPEEG